MTLKEEAEQLAKDRPTSLSDDLYQWAMDAEEMLWKLSTQAAQPAGKVCITTDQAGAIVAVARQDSEGRILEIIAEVVQPSRAGLSDTALLDWLQAKGGQWVCRDSTTGRGWRLHQSQYTGSLSVREAIIAAINAKQRT